VPRRHRKPLAEALHAAADLALQRLASYPS
jgi:hypothetical protein